MKRNFLISIALLGIFTSAAAAGKPSDRDRVLEAMKRATHFMMDSVGYQGAFLWEYSFENKLYWGEVQARRTMGWAQGEGSPAVGDVLLDAYHATGDQYYYDAACVVANALVRVQLPCGGWNYCFDMAGEGALKDWYAAMRQYKWPAQEFMHYYGNATFDDQASAKACEFILRMYLEKNDPRYKQSLDKAIDFVLAAQYPNGGWPQRFPLSYEHPYMGFPDYSSFITLNDGAMQSIIEFLINCYDALGDQRLIDPIYRGMHCVRSMQYASPNAGWGLQYTVTDLKLATARPFEPAALAASGTQSGIEMMMKFYTLTGDKRFLEGIPAALTYLESIEVDDETVALAKRKLGPGDILCPTFIDPVTREAFFLKRVGESLWTGSYAKSDIKLGLHQGYSSVRVIRLESMRKRYEALLKTPVEKIVAASPLTALSRGKVAPYAASYGRNPNREAVFEVIGKLNRDGAWVAPMNQNKTAQRLDLRVNRPANAVETAAEPIAEGITTQAYMDNMVMLIDYLRKN